MGRATGWALALGLLLFSPGVVDAQTLANSPDPTRDLIQGCLKTPSPDAVAQLASAVGATPYSEQRRQSELQSHTSSYENPATGDISLTRTTVTEFHGWDLHSPGAGIVAYQELKVEADLLNGSTRKPIRPTRTALAQSCRVEASVANARAVFERYEGLTEREYGIRISKGGLWVNVFMINQDQASEDQYDIELNLGLEAPLAGVTPDATRNTRLVVPDGGPRFPDQDAHDVPDGIPTAVLTRSALLEALDHPAKMTFFHTEFQLTPQPPVPLHEGSQP